jgi:hypothetical protein
MALHARRSLIPNASRRWATASASPRASPLLSHEVLQGRVVQHGISQQPFQPRVLILERLQPLGLRDFRPTELGLPFVDARVADATLAAQIGDRNAGLMLLQDSDDLLFRKAATLHALVLVWGQNELQTGLSPWGKVISPLATNDLFLSLSHFRSGYCKPVRVAIA